MRVRFDTPPGSATQSQGLAVRYAAARRRVSSWRWYLLFVGVVALPLYFGLQLLLALVWVTAPGQVELQQAAVKAGASGHVTLLATAGQEVRAGQAVARVDPVAPLAQAPARIADVRPGPDLESAAAAQEDAARGALALALQQLSLRERARRTFAELVAQGAATAAEQDAAEARWAEAQAGVVRARAELVGASQASRRLRAGSPSPAPASGAVASWPVPAPIAGRVVRLPAPTGDWVAPDSEVAVIQGVAAPVVRAWLQPADARFARIGTEAELRFFDGSSAQARVLRLEPETTRVPPDRLGPLAARGQALVVVMQPQQPLPERYRVHELPVEVRFKRWAR